MSALRATKSALNDKECLPGVDEFDERLAGVVPWRSDDERFRGVVSARATRVGCASGR